MSPWSAERVRAVIGGTGIATLRSRGWFGRANAGGGSIELAAAPDWAPALEALRAELDMRKPASASFVVSGRWCRLALLPWKEGLDDAEALALARFVLEDRFGEPARDWELAVDALPRGESMVACAIEGALMRSLTSLCTERGIRLASVQPLLVAAMNEHRASGRGRRWELLVEADWWSWALVDGDALLAVGGQAAQGGWAGLAAILANEALRAGQADTEIPVRVLAGAPGIGLEAMPDGKRISVLGPGPRQRHVPPECVLAAYAA